MTNKSSLSIALSQEELFVILAYLHAENLLGLEPEIFKELSKDQINLVMGVAERALVARGFLKPGPENRLQLEPAVFATLGACAFPETSLIVTRHRPDAVGENYFFHTSRKMIVMHTMPVTAIHQFIAVEEKTAVARAVLSILSMDSLSKPKCAAGQIEQAILVNARDTAQGQGSEEAFKMLSQTNLGKKTAQELAETLTHPVANTTLAYIKHNVEGQPSDGFTILQGQNALWLLAPVEGAKTELISILPVSAEDAARRVKTLMKL